MEKTVVEELKRCIRFIPTVRKNRNRVLGIGCKYQKGLKDCIIEKGKWETYLNSLDSVDDGDESSDIDIGDLMPAPWWATGYLATGPYVHLFNPRAKGNQFYLKGLK